LGRYFEQVLEAGIHSVAQSIKKVFLCVCVCVCVGGGGVIGSILHVGPETPTGREQMSVERSGVCEIIGVIEIRITASAITNLTSTQTNMRINI